MNRLGAWGEYVNAPARCLLDWPETVSAEEACLAEPLGNGVHVVRLTEAYPADLALVIGAGPIGLMCQQALQAIRGSRVVVSDLSDARLDTAIRLGAVAAVNPRSQDLAEVIAEMTDGEGVDLVVDAVGGRVTKQQSIEAVRPGGSVVWIGLMEDEMSIDSFGVTLPEKRIFRYVRRDAAGYAGGGRPYGK